MHKQEGINARKCITESPNYVFAFYSCCSTDIPKIKELTLMNQNKADDTKVEKNFTQPHKRPTLIWALTQHAGVGKDTAAVTGGAV